MKDHHAEARQRWIAEQQQREDYLERKRTEALEYLGTHWCLHQRSTFIPQHRRTTPKPR